MMDFDDLGTIAAILLGVLAAIILGFCIGGAVGTTSVQHDAIKHHAAHYDPQTADFTWDKP